MHRTLKFGQRVCGCLRLSVRLSAACLLFAVSVSTSCAALVVLHCRLAASEHVAHRVVVGLIINLRFMLTYYYLSVFPVG